MSDQVTITWEDATGVYENAFLIESPSLDDVRKTSNPMMMPTAPAEETDAEFYARLSLQMVNQIMHQAQQNQMQQAMAKVPPVSITPVEPTAKE